MRVVLLWQLATCALSVSGFLIPTALRENARKLTEDVVERKARVRQRAIARGVPLRIEPLGASITHGVASTSGDGYRRALRTTLRGLGNQVNMVGSHPNGTMRDRENEGWPGFTVEGVNAKAGSVRTFKPNLVLINAGTNDAIQNKDVPNVQKRMRAMLADIYAWSPRATVVLSALVPNRRSDVNTRVTTINRQYSALAVELQAAGKRIVYLDSQATNGGLQLSDIGPDGTHPTDAGYDKFAKLWLSAIREADSRGFIVAPEAVEGLADNGPDDV